MTQQVPLNESRYVVLDGSGNGTVGLGPISARETWSPSNVHVQTNVRPVVNEATCVIYVGSTATANNFRDSTFSGSSGDSSDRVSADTVRCGDKVWAVWSGGDAGAQATLAVTGVKAV